MMPEQGFKDFIDRAMCNLQFIEERESPIGPFAVTQLFATVLLVAGWPNEKEVLPEKMRNMSLADSVARGFPAIDVRTDFPEYEPKTLGDMMRLLRNSVAHANIRFHGEHGRIAEITLSDRRWNRDKKRNESRTTNRIPVETIREALSALQRIATEEFERAIHR